MMITKTAIALIAIGNIFYATVVFLARAHSSTSTAMGDGSAFMIKLAGTFCAGLGFMLAYVLMTGTAGTWELFTYGFVQAALLTVVGYQTVNGPWAEVEGVKATKEGYMAPAVFAVLNAVVLFTGAETLYA